MMIIMDAAELLMALWGLEFLSWLQSSPYSVALAII
jgi:hypothetical protein